MPTQPNHTRFVIGCITLLAMTSALCGGWLLWKGFAGGGELIMTVNSAVAGMIGFLSNQRQPTGNAAPESQNPETNPSSSSSSSSSSTL